LNSTGNSCCRPTALSSSKFCVAVPICSITPVGLPVRHYFADLVHVRLVRHLHGDDLDPVLACGVEYIPEASTAMP
jgi:hypothetical protein